jgi:hypothetical protein
MGFSPELFDEVLEENRREARHSVLEASPVAQAIIEHMAARKVWSGTATELWYALETFRHGVCDQRSWPTNGRVLSNELRRVEPDLRATGICVSYIRSRDKRTIMISRAFTGGPITSAAV